MTPLLLVLAVAAITVGSRVAALVLLPEPRGRVVPVIQRLPPPLFAALAALSVSGSLRGAGAPAMLAALGCAVVASRAGSLLLTLGAGLTGFTVATVFT